jgi:hypothetical protein
MSITILGPRLTKRVFCELTPSPYGKFDILRKFETRAKISGNGNCAHPRKFGGITESMAKIIVLLYLVLISQSLFATPTDIHPSYVSCGDDEVKYQLRSKELQQIVKADQDDRKGLRFNDTQARDRQRRERVGAIFGEGCFKEARDYAAAALVFQHGDQPEHFFQTYIWATRSVELGDISQKNLAAQGMDRYLVNTGHKQLFATQYLKPTTQADACWCLYQTEISFPDHLRVEYTGLSYLQSLKRLQKKLVVTILLS